MGKRDKHIAGEQPRGLARKSVPAMARRPVGLVVPRPGNLVVRWNRFDFDGPWCLARSDAVTIVELMKQIKSFESMTPKEVFDNPGTEVGKDYGDPSCLPNEAARRRLDALGLMDQTNISRLRCGNKPRLYGFRVDPEFYAVFWDPEHLIWPSAKRNT